MKISYPFAAIPNHVIRGGHGAVNIAVLAALLSHGRTTASIRTLAVEIGCDYKSILPGIRYWMEHGVEFGIEIITRGGGKKSGTPTIYEVVIHEMKDAPRPKTGEGKSLTSPENGRPPRPETGEHPRPKTGDKEEPVKKNPEEEKVASARADAGRQVGEIFDVFKKTVNPMINFGHRTQRAAAEKLIAVLGFEVALESAKFAVAIQGSDRFTPVITNPYQLVMRWGELVVHLKKSSSRPKGIDLDALDVKPQALAV